MRPHPECQAAGVVHDPDHHLGIDYERCPRPARSSARRRGHPRRDRGNLGLLEAVLLPAGRRVERDPGQRPAGQEPTRPQDGRLRRGLAGPARRARPGPALVRAAPAGARATGPDPSPHPAHPRARSDRPAPGEAAGGHQDQTGPGRLRHHGRLRPGHAGGTHPRRTKSPGPRGDGQAQAPQHDPRAHRGADRPLPRPPRLPDPAAPGSLRPAHRRHRATGRPDRGGDGSLSSRARPARHRPRDQPGRRRGDHRGDRRRHEPFSPPPSTSPPGPGSAPAITSPPAAPRTPRSAPATRISRAPSALRHSARPGPRKPICRPATNG